MEHNPVRGKSLPSQEMLRELFDYDPESGILTRIKGKQSALGPAGWKHKSGYLAIIIGGNNKFLVHRVIWKWVTGCDPEVIDHRDRDRSNNRWANLRNCSQTENSGNAVKRARNKSGYKNISRPPKNESGWIIQIVRSGVVHCKRSRTLAGAIALQRLMSLQIYGDFARSA